MPCNPPKTIADKMWPYTEYYTGARDEENRKHGKGIHHWTGAESQESYTGHMLRDTMHGYGDYRWRYLGADHYANTYEGRFYNNRMHGYGFMSYPDGRVFNGLWHNNFRWGPGVETHTCLRENVGLWFGYQLYRLSWRPSVPSVAIDLTSIATGCNVVAPNRTILSTNVKIIGEVNSALELLKQSGSKPLAAADKWAKLYPKNCTDQTSQLCQIEAFDRAYYNNQINMLNEVTATPVMNFSESSKESVKNRQTYYSWNNNQVIIHMMKHCFTHEDQRMNTRVKLQNIMSGSRSSFKTAGKHELDCRTLIMASYLGHISNVAQLINESDVMPDVSDSQGNSVIMYAACGDQTEIIHFLVEAGADIDAYNDACCTPLGITLLRYALEKWDIQYNAMLQALLPPKTGVETSPLDETILEWNITRNEESASNNLRRNSSKLNSRVAVGKKISQKEVSAVITKKKSEASPKIEVQKSVIDSKTDPSAEVYDTINTEYMKKVAEAFAVISKVNPIPYIFEVQDMCKDGGLITEEETKKVTDKTAKRTVSNVLKGSMKPSKVLMWQDKENNEFNSIEQMKQDKISRIMSTIDQLLSEGADPRKVRCPQTALFIAIVAGCEDLIRQLIKHGADVNEVYPQAFGYSAIDLAVSRPLTNNSLNVIRCLLECGANPDHRLQEPQPQSRSTVLMEFNKEGPTLLHTVLARKTDPDPDNTHDLQQQLLELLLEYGCNPITQYKGCSAVDLAMNKSMNLFEIIITNPTTDLNAIINDSNQTILVKMFYLPFCSNILLPEKLQMLTNILLFGADPLIKCQDGEDEYGNLFVYVRKVLSEMEETLKPSPPTIVGPASKSKTEHKTKKENKVPAKATGAGAKPGGKGGGKAGGQGSKNQSGILSEDNSADYRQTLELVTECARLLYIRWLQAKLMKELIDVVSKFKHRPWNMILKEHNNNKKSTGLWLNAPRCLEIWDILKTTKKKIYNDEGILKKVLFIIHFYYKRTWKILRCPSMTSPEKDLIESEVTTFIHDHKLATMSTPEMVPVKRPYVIPELTVKGIEKFNVCFDCALPLADENIPCGSCNLIAFCSFACMKTNIDRSHCHPCNSYLKEKYFPNYGSEASVLD